ncbi:polyketide cyclase [Micromonospora arida]|uniref:polyketide cyclase n=1 Tax=Micromonospora arida TaxID=2203715 RepID=UPI0033AD17AB
MADDGCVIGDRWGVTNSETLRTYPCDDFVVSPTLQAWRGVRIDVPAPAVWPWVTQLRLAPYSYDWIDNLGRRSPRQLEGLPEPQVGESFTTAGGRKLGRIVAVDPGVAPGLSVGDLIMARRQLLNLKKLAEGSELGR